MFGETSIISTSRCTVRETNKMYFRISSGDSGKEQFQVSTVLVWAHPLGLWVLIRLREWIMNLFNDIFSVA
jgi:hypothetical protein